MSMGSAMLCIVTDAGDFRWLKYLMEEFSRVNKSEFTIRSRNLDQCTTETNNTIYYTKQPISGVCIPNRSCADPKGNIQWLSENIYLFEDSLVDGWPGDCRYDIFWNAFVFLSRFEEYLYEDEGKKIHSYARSHPRKDKSTFDVPVVNHLFDELEGLIKKHFPALRFGGPAKPTIELSHDVDYLNKTLQLRLKQTAFNILNTLKSLSSPSRCTRQLFNTVRFLCSSPSYWCFDYWTDLEKKYDLRSTFYIYAKTGSNSLISWLLDPSYDIRGNSDLQIKLKQIIQDDFQVGLHGSFRGATDEKKLRQEKKVLEESLQTEVSKVRQHWLRYKEKTTPYLHGKLFKYDSTLGWNDRMGFRCGCACRHRPYDHLNHQAFPFFVTPQVIMDSNIFHYSNKKVRHNLQKALNLLKSLSYYKTSHVSISWHQRVRCSDYEWHEFYEEILNTLFGVIRSR